MDPDTGEPLDKLAPKAKEVLRDSLGVTVETISEVLDRANHEEIYTAIQEGLDRANKQAISNAQKVN